MELWDAYDASFHKVENVTLIRGEPIPEGLFHLVCDVIVKHADGDYLLMQRDSRKHHGGMWEATAGGSALRGESPLDCAVRELHEETGIDAKQLVEVGRVVGEQNHTLYVEFSCVTDQPKNSVILQEGETSDYKWVGKDELVSMKKSELVTERMQNFVKELQAEEEKQ
ncbi:MAG: NUDIX hydrolase [Ruminococcaceae bacterium]|nr:NUDIX hydrolase [Oscillospiraceae bacterium]